MRRRQIRAGLVCLEAGGPGRHESGTDHPHTSGTTGERYLEPPPGAFPARRRFLSEGTAESDCSGKRQQHLRPPVWPYWRAAGRAEGFEGMGN